MTEIGMNQVLGQIRALSAAAADRPVADTVQEADKAVNFGSMLRSSIQQVSESQKLASELAVGFERGDKDISLAEVMVARQKASVSFEAAIQVRNRLLEAYREVMNMQV